MCAERRQPERFRSASLRMWADGSSTGCNAGALFEPRHGSSWARDASSPSRITGRRCTTSMTARCTHGRPSSALGPRQLWTERGDDARLGCVPASVCVWRVLVRAWSHSAWHSATMQFNHWLTHNERCDSAAAVRMRKTRDYHNSSALTLRQRVIPPDPGTGSIFCPIWQPMRSLLAAAVPSIARVYVR